MESLIRDLISAVRAYAVEHFEIDGWDYVAEGFDDEYIAELIDGCDTAEDAIAAVHKTVMMLDDHRRDMKAIFR